MKPLVTVICISYNHAPFIREALESVFNQTYERLEILILDDASSDQSLAEIKSYIGEKEGIEIIAHTENQGYTRTFNEGLSMAKGEFIVDFALDDVMAPNFIEESIKRLEKAGEDFGVCYSNANYIDQDSKVIANHKDRLIEKGLIKEMPSGDVFEMILRRYFICTPTMVIRRSVLDRLNGYDETLDYEDFDFWVRSSRFTGYVYLDQSLMSKRKLPNSMSAQQYQYKSNTQLISTYKVCEKALQLVKTKPERKALAERIEFELGQCLTIGAFDLGLEFYQILKSLKDFSIRLLVYKTLLALKMNYRFLNKYRKKGLL